MENKITDTLSWKINTIYNNNYQSDLKQKIISTTINDKNYEKMRDKLQNNNTIDEEL